MKRAQIDALLKAGDRLSAIAFDWSRGREGWWINAEDQKMLRECCEAWDCAARELREAMRKPMLRRRTPIKRKKRP